MTRTLLIVFATLALAACGRGEIEGQAPAPGTPGFATAPTVGPDTERTWVGLLPCSDCKGIDTRLVLRSRDGRRTYLMTETYLGSIGNNSFDTAGTWNEAISRSDGQVLYILDPERAGQRFALQPDGNLEALDGNGNPSGQGLAYRLQRL